MKLTFVVKGPDRLMGHVREKSMEHGSLVIGRSPDADWTLPDPARMISKLHCRVDADFSGFVLTDTSTNGVKVNEELVGFGLPRLLKDGDILQLGDAVIVARVENTSARPVKSEGDKQPACHHKDAGTADGPFGLFVEPPLKAHSESTAAGPSIEQILDHWWSPEPPTSSPSCPVPSALPFGDTPKDKDGSEFQSPDTPEEKLAISLAGIDLRAFASAVRTAAEVLSAGERRRFQERLSELVEQSASRKA
jgi:predicted component of type VI protein secretion system